MTEFLLILVTLNVKLSLLASFRAQTICCKFLQTFDRGYYFLFHNDIRRPHRATPKCTPH